MPESKLSRASHIAQLVGLVPSFICCYYAVPPSQAGTARVASTGDPMSGVSPKILISFGVALACFLIGGILSGLSWLKARKDAKEPDVEEQFYRDNPPGEIIGFGGRDTLEEVQAEQARVFALGNQLDGLFSPLQVEGLRLAYDLGKFAEDVRQRPKYSEGASQTDQYAAIMYTKSAAWVIKMQAEYERDYAGRVCRFVSNLEIHEGRFNPRLRNFKDHIIDLDSVNTVRAQIWKEVMFTLDIDFQGE